MGYPPPCQPPLVAAGSSSPSSTPRSIFQIVDALLPRRLLPSGRVSVHLPPKWLDSRVVQFNSPKVVSLIPVSILSPKSSFRLVGRFISEEMIGSNQEVRFHTFPKKVVARFPSMVGPFPFNIPKDVSWFGFRPWFQSRSFSTKPLFVTEVVPKNCYCYTFRLSTVIGTSTTSCGPPCTILPKVVWLILCRSSESSCGCGNFFVRKLRSSLTPQSLCLQSS